MKRIVFVASFAMASLMTVGCLTDGNTRMSSVSTEASSACYYSDYDICITEIDSATCVDDVEGTVQSSCSSDYVETCTYSGYSIFIYDDSEISCDDLED